MKAVKGNREYDINGAQSRNYRDAGFDIQNEDGEVLAYGRGKTVPYDEHVHLMEENKELHARIAELETAAAKTEKKPPKKPAEKDGE